MFGYHTQKYDPSGGLVWDEPYKASADISVFYLGALAVDNKNGGVYMSGLENNNRTGSDIFTIKYEDSAPPVFRRGDSDADGELDLTDAIWTLLHLFLGGEAPPCQKAADADDSGVVDVTDAFYTLHFLFLGEAPPPPPGAEACGPDPTRDDLTCSSRPRCER